MVVVDYVEDVVGVVEMGVFGFKFFIYCVVGGFIELVDVGLGYGWIGKVDKGIGVEGDDGVVCLGEVEVVFYGFGNSVLLVCCFFNE